MDTWMKQNLLRLQLLLSKGRRRRLCGMLLLRVRLSCLHGRRQRRRRWVLQDVLLRVEVRGVRVGRVLHDLAVRMAMTVGCRLLLVVLERQLLLLEVSERVGMRRRYGQRRLTRCGRGERGRGNGRVGGRRRSGVTVRQRRRRRAGRALLLLLCGRPLWLLRRLRLRLQWLLVRLLEDLMRRGCDRRQERESSGIASRRCQRRRRQGRVRRRRTC